MATINWKTYDTGETVTEIRQNRRYKLASPSTVTGAPSLAMQSATQFAVVYVYVDDVKISTPLTISGTTKTPITINGQTPSQEELLTLSIEVGGIGNGEVIYTTDEPNGSPSNPFPGAAALLAAHPVTGAILGETVWMVNPAVPWGKSRLWRVGVAGTADDWAPLPGEVIVYGRGSGGAPLASLGTGLLTVQTVWQSAPIPDAFLPDGVILRCSSEQEVKNTVSPALSSKMQFSLGPQDSVAALNNNSLAYASVVPTASGSKLTLLYVDSIPTQRVGSVFKGPGGALPNTNESARAYTSGQFSTGATRALCLAQPSHASDVISVWSCKIAVDG